MIFDWNFKKLGEIWEKIEWKVFFQELGLFYLGEMVNVFCHGSLTATQVDVAPLYHSSILYGTSDGGIGAIVQMSPALYS